MSISSRFAVLAVRAATSLVAVHGLVGCSGEVGGTDTPVGRQSSAIQGGTTDTNTAHNYAVGVANRAGGVCSGTLIAPNLVLTARHCVVPPTADESVTCADTFTANVAPSQMFVTTEPNLFRAKAYYAASKIITPADKGFCGNDIALIILAKSVPASEAQPATPVVQFKMTDKRLSGAITAMGYGITSPSADDSGQRRIRKNIPLLCIPGSEEIDCSGDLAQFSDNAAEFVTEGYVCSGDSGSGAFDQKSFDNGNPYVLGALSRGPQTEQRCLAAIYSRTDAHATMIVDAGLEAAEKGGYTAPAWTAPEVVEGANDPVSDGCVGDTCTDVSATDPANAPRTTTTTSSGCSAAPRSFGAAGGSTFLVGLALSAVFAARRRKSR